MKKVLFIIMAFAVLLCGCSGKTAPVTQDSPAAQSTPSASESQSANMNEIDQTIENEEQSEHEESAGESVNNEDEIASNTINTEATQNTGITKWQDIFTGRATIEETVLVDEENIKITATDLSYNSYQASVSLLIENNTDKDLSFTSNTWGDSCNSVNGYMMSSGWINEDVAAGKKAKATASFGLNELAIYGMTDIAEIQLGFRIVDDDYDEYLTTGPRSIRTSAYGAYDLSEDTYRENIQKYIKLLSNDVQIDGFMSDVTEYQNGVRVLSTLFIVNGDGEQLVMIEFENTTNEDRIVSIANMMLNDLMINSGTWTSDRINANSRCITSINLSNCLEDYYWEMLPLNQYSSFSCRMDIKDMNYNVLSSDSLTVTNDRPVVSLEADGLEVCNNETCRMVFLGIEQRSFCRL